MSMNVTQKSIPVLHKRPALITMETLSVYAPKDMKDMEKTIAAVSTKGVANYSP